MDGWNVIPVDDVADPRLRAYEQLTDRELSREGNRFIAQGVHLVERLLRSGLSCESVLLTPRAFERLIAFVPPGVPVYRMSMERAMRMVGFKFHTGALAVGVRPANATLEQLASSQTLLVCPQLNMEDNLGSIIRTGVSLGAGGVMVGSRCVDPFTRRTVRVSMGSIFSVPVRVTGDVAADLVRLRGAYGFDVLASVLDPHAPALHTYRRAARVALVLGSEDRGLDEATIAACSHRVTIPMRPGQDSLNVAVAAGVMLYQLGVYTDPP